MESIKQILEIDYSEAFDKLRKNRMVVSHYKYGWCKDTYPELAQAYKCIKERLDLYEKTGNKEYLVDVANFAMIEFEHPAIPVAYFKAEDSDKSPGLAGGISVSCKELMEGEMVKMSYRANILKEAEETICRDRNYLYGKPEQSFDEIAKVWSFYLGIELNAKDAAIMLALFKVARMKTSVKLNKDNFLDAIGYMACAYEVAQERESKEKENAKGFVQEVKEEVIKSQELEKELS